MKKYGVEHNLHRKEIKYKIKQTNLEKYGVEYVMQCQEIMDKNVKSAYKSKEYFMPSRNIIKIQGYEHFALNELLEKVNVDESDIITGCKIVPSF